MCEKPPHYDFCYNDGFLCSFAHFSVATDTMIPYCVIKYILKTLRVPTQKI